MRDPPDPVERPDLGTRLLDARDEPALRLLSEVPPRGALERPEGVFVDGSARRLDEDAALEEMPRLRGSSSSTT